MAGHETDHGPISCTDALRFLQEFLDGETEGVTHEHVKAHFDVCEECYPHLQLQAAFRAVLQRACGGPCAPPELKARLLEALEKAQRE